MTRSLLPIVVMLSMVACDPATGSDVAVGTVSAAQVAPASSTLARWESEGLVAALNIDEGTVSLVAVEAGAVLQELELGGEPTRMTQLGDALFVTLRVDGVVVALTRRGESLQERARRLVGVEPYGIVASPDSAFVYVALGLEDRVVELDAVTLDETRSWDVPGEPRWLAMHPSGASLAVGSVRNDPLRRIDLRDGTIEIKGLPEVGNRRANAALVETTPRITGDMAFNPAGTELAVPMLYSDVLDRAPSSTVAYYAPPAGEDFQRLNPVVVVVPSDPGGDGFHTSLARPHLVPASLVGDGLNRGLRTSYVNAVAYSPSGETWYLSLEGADLIAAAPIDQRDDSRGSNGTYGTPALLFRTDGGPAAIAAGETVLVHSAFDRTLNRLVELPSFNGFELASPDEVSDAERVASLGDSVLDDEVRIGRALFYSTYDPRMTSGGVSCATCHVEGRSDGLSWAVTTGTWQTPSLAGGIGDTQPYTWSESVATIGAEAALTTVVRMGGTGLSLEDQQAIAAFIGSIRAPVTPDSDPEDVAAGRQVFEQAGCAECHAGAALTDGDHHVLFSATPLNTPSLRGIGATAPYLHNGQAETLHELLDDAQGIMGTPEALSEAELDLLVVYLRSL